MMKIRIPDLKRYITHCLSLNKDAIDQLTHDTNLKYRLYKEEFESKWYNKLFGLTCHNCFSLDFHLKMQKYDTKIDNCESILYKLEYYENMGHTTCSVDTLSQNGQNEFFKWASENKVFNYG